MNCSSNALFNIITNTSQQGKLFCCFKQNKTTDMLLCVFKKLGFIYGFFLIKNCKTYYIVLKQDSQGQPTIKKIVIWSTPGQHFFVSAYRLNSIAFKSALAETILATNKGVITAQKAIGLNVGGLLLCRIIV